MRCISFDSQFLISIFGFYISNLLCWKKSASKNIGKYSRNWFLKFLNLETGSFKKWAPKSYVKFRGLEIQKILFRTCRRDHELSRNVKILLKFNDFYGFVALPSWTIFLKMYEKWGFITTKFVISRLKIRIETFRIREIIMHVKLNISIKKFLRKNLAQPSSRRFENLLIIRIKLASTYV